MTFLFEAAVFLAAAVVAVPLSKRLGFGSVLGYLLAGAAIGPWGLRLVSDVESILHFGELGVVLLLFLIGLELQPSRLWTMRRPVFGAGGLQVAVTAALLAGACMAFGMAWPAAVTVGLALSLSSTAFALQIMAEKGHLTSRYGRTAFAILLFQDIAAIPMIALVPLLAGGGETGPDALFGAAKVAAVIAAVIVVGRYALRFLLRAVAAAKVREIFTACGLLTVIGTALLMQSVGLSMALGAFIAGVLLADSEVRHALEADIEPFKGLLLGLFFIAVGMSVNFGLLITEILLVLALVAGLVALKAGVFWIIGGRVGLPRDGRMNLAIALSQGGEFAFVIFGIATTAAVMDRSTADLVILVVTLSMAVTPVLFLISEATVKNQVETPNMDAHMPESSEHPVIIAGFGRFGQIIGRILRAKRIGFTALELDPNQVNFVAKYGNKVYYGDSTRYDVMAAAGAAEAKVLLLAVDDPEQSLKTAELVARRFPNLTVIARARDRQHAFRLMEAGVVHVIRETFYSGIEAGRLTLENIGFAAKDARHVVDMFRDHDERRLRNQFGAQGDEASMLADSVAWAQQLEELFAEDAATDKAPEETKAE